MAFLSAAMFVGACEAQASSLQGIVTDSAGVRVVRHESFPRSEALRWSVDPSPAVSIGLLNGPQPYLFSRIVGAVAVEGGYVIADGDSGELRLFGPDGRHVRSAGGSGDGPGEFRQLRWMGRTPGDSILAWDLARRTVALFDPELRYVRTEPLAQAQIYGMQGPSSRFDDGALLVWPFGFATEPNIPGQVQAPRMALAVGRPGSESLDTLVRLPNRPSYVHESGSFERLPFKAYPAFTVDGATVWAGDGSQGVLTRFSRAGVPELILRLPMGGPVGASHVARFRDAALADLTGAERTQRARELAALPFPSAFPAFDLVRTGVDGNVWVRRYPRPDEAGQSWTIFDPSGAVVGWAELPGSVRDFEVGRESILFVHRDDLGVESIRAHPLRRR
jgi:hypothetical protein